MTYLIIACILLLPYGVRLRFRSRKHRIGIGIGL